MNTLQTCTRCLYDSTIPKIAFNADLICNYCQQYDQMNLEYPTGAEGRRKLEEIAKVIRKDGKGKKYDVVVGVSGGCDSSYLLCLAKELGLRPLAAHFDNTWNSRIAVENIQVMLEKLKIDLFTYVVDNKEYNDLFRAFLLASVPEIDTPSDIGLATTHYLAARKYGIRYIWEGHSFRTEGITPEGWFYMDGKYIESIHRRYGTVPLRTFPNLRLGRWLKWIIINKIRKIRPLYYLDYNKEAVKTELTQRYNWQWYGGHHMENRTAYFTNNFYLPRKFGIDLRVCELSALVRSKQLTRPGAQKILSEPKPFDPEIMNEVYKRLFLTEREFNQLMEQRPKSFRDYETYKRTFIKMRPLFYLLYRTNFVTKSFYSKFCF